MSEEEEVFSEPAVLLSCEGALKSRQGTLVTKPVVFLIAIDVKNGWKVCHFLFQRELAC